jgi:hypothetical protein
VDKIRLVEFELVGCQQCLDDINVDLLRVYSWSKSNGLKLTPTQSQVIVIYHGRREIPPPSLFIGQYQIEIVSKVADLGFTLNESLSATDHFTKVCQKVYWILRSLRPHASHILPHFTYVSVVVAEMLRC